VLLGATLDADAAVQVAGISGAALPGSRVVPQLAGSFGRTAVTHLEGGALLATGHRDGTVRLWDPTTGAPLATLVGSADGWAAAPRWQLQAERRSGRPLVGCGPVPVRAA